MRLIGRNKRARWNTQTGPKLCSGVLGGQRQAQLVQNCRGGGKHDFLGHASPGDRPRASSGSDGVRAPSGASETAVALLRMGGKDLDAALAAADVFGTQEGKARVSITALQLLFIVIDGNMPSTYFKRCDGRGRNTRWRICTCSTFAQKGNCPHVWYAAALLQELDLEQASEWGKPGRKRSAAAPEGKPVKRRRSRTPCR